MESKVGRPKLSSFAICKISIACLRHLPTHKSYQISQILFGEYVEIISRKNRDWIRVRCCWDGSIGWADPKQLHVLKAKEVHLFEDCDTFSLEHLHGLSSADKTIPISIGSNLYKCDGLNVKMPFGHFQYSGQIIQLSATKSSTPLLIAIAKRFLHCPYVYGGRSILGIDAPGLVQVIYKMMGYKLPRHSAEQAKLGVDIGFVTQCEVGDLAFFENENQLITHVGLILEDNTILHAYGQTRIDQLDQQGIYNKKQKRYTFKLRTIRRIFIEHETKSPLN